jgi:hypothetical protein
MKKITLQELKKIVEDNWGFVRNQRAKKSGDMWSNAVIAHHVNWTDKLGLDKEPNEEYLNTNIEETIQGLSKLKDIVSNPTLSAGAKKAKTKSLVYELDPTDFKDPAGSMRGSTHKSVIGSITKGDMDSLATTISSAENGEHQKNNFNKFSFLNKK